MIVEGITIQPVQIEACLKRMQEPGTWFTCSVMHAAERAGVMGGDVAMRLADRLVQRERRLGRIRQVARGIWEWSQSNGNEQSGGTD